MTPDTHLQRLFAAIETLDLDTAVSFFSPSARLYFCNILVASGRPAIRRVLLPLFTCVDGIRHQTIALWSQGGVSVVEADVEYSSVHGGLAAMPVTSVLLAFFKFLHARALKVQAEMLSPPPAG